MRGPPTRRCGSRRAADSGMVVTRSVTARRTRVRFPPAPRVLKPEFEHCWSCPGSLRRSLLLGHLHDVVDRLLRGLVVRLGCRDDLAPVDVPIVVVLVLGDAATAVRAHAVLLTEGTVGLAGVAQRSRTGTTDPWPRTRRQTQCRSTLGDGMAGWRIDPHERRYADHKRRATGITDIAHTRARRVDPVDAEHGIHAPTRTRARSGRRRTPGRENAPAALNEPRSLQPCERRQSWRGYGRPAQRTPTPMLSNHTRGNSPT